MPVNLLYYVFLWQAARNKVPKIQLKIDSFLSCLLCVARFISLVRRLSYDWVIHRSVLGGFTKNKQTKNILTKMIWDKDWAWLKKERSLKKPAQILLRTNFKNDMKMWLKAKYKELRGDSRLLHTYEQQLLIVFLGKSVSTWQIMIKGTKPSYQEHVLAYKTLVWCGFSKCPSQYCVIGPTLVIIHLR